MGDTTMVMFTASPRSRIIQYRLVRDNFETVGVIMAMMLEQWKDLEHIKFKEAKDTWAGDGNYMTAWR